MTVIILFKTDLRTVRKLSPEHKLRRRERKVIDI